MQAAKQSRFDLTAAEARAVQRALAGKVFASGDITDVHLVAGVDCSVGPRGSTEGRAAIVVLEWPSLRPVEQVIHHAPIPFPYVPGLLSFRELPLILPAVERLRSRPDLFVVDGQGTAHPRRFGIACHLGVLLDKPAIGCAKSRLTGAPAADLPDERGARVPLHDHGDLVGYLLRTKPSVKPLWVSPGHRIGPAEAAEWVFRLSARHRLPEPTRLADRAAAGVQVVPDSEAVTQGRLLPAET